MATLKVFISSTCYDLGVVRSKLQEFFRSLGYDPILSEYSDVLFDPRTHTHTSCIDEVANCDVMVLLVGARFGGKGVPEALSRIDLTKLKSASSATWSLEDGRPLSITQLEVLRAIDLKQPVFAFVDERVMHDHLVYEKNKQKSILGDITFPSIERQETAQYIFEFINFLRLRNAGNSITTFARIDDIEVHLRKQWSGLFQRLLREERVRVLDLERARQIQQQLDELKTAILSTIQAPEAREIARGVIRFRRFIDFAWGLRLPNKSATILDDGLTWERLMSAAGIERIARTDSGDSPSPPRVYLLMQGGNFIIARMPIGVVLDLVDETRAFAGLPRKLREAILEAWTENGVSGRLMLMPPETFDEYIGKRQYPMIIEYYDAVDPTRTPEIKEYSPSGKRSKRDDDDDIPF